jgi:hypothetical protein
MKIALSFVFGMTTVSVAMQQNPSTMAEAGTVDARSAVLRADSELV